MDVSHVRCFAQQNCEVTVRESKGQASSMEPWWKLGHSSGTWGGLVAWSLGPHDPSRLEAKDHHSVGRYQRGHTQSRSNSCQWMSSSGMDTMDQTFKSTVISHFGLVGSGFRRLYESKAAKYFPKKGPIEKPSVHQVIIID